jgi:hypothetical protein
VDLQSFLDGFQIPKTKESVRKKVVIFMSDDDYAQLLGEFFDNPMLPRWQLPSRCI